MKKKLLPFLIAILLLFLIGAGYFGIKILEQYIPTKEQADIHALLNISDNQAAILLNGELQETKGIYVEDQTFIPITWVNENINERFYWDDNEKILVYALPEKLVYADSDTKGSNGKPLLWVNDSGVYLSLGLVANYTDVRISAFDGGENKRILIDSRWGELDTANIKKSGKVRVKGGVKSPIITETREGDHVYVLEQMEKWSRIITVDGYIGYVENKKLADVAKETVTSTFAAPVYTNISLDKKISLVWHQVTIPDANDEMERLIAATKGVNVIAPTWFKLTDNNGNYASLASKSYVDKAHELGLQVWALLDNFENEVQSEVLLSATSTRKKLIDSLMNEADVYGFDGINLDFEGIKKEAGPHYVQFIREMSVACRNKGLVLSIDNYVPAAYNAFYNRKEQGIVADYVIVMGYDEHYAGGDAGSVASIGYVEKGISDTLEMVPKEKVINGVPLYTRLWTDADSGMKSKALGISKAQDWIEQNQVELYWQEELGQSYGECVNSDGKNYLWMEDAKSLSVKMDVIKKYDLAGVGAWKLGLETPDIWDVIRWDE